MINGIGLFCHEFSHTMGLPDFYPLTAEAQIDNQGMEYWDLMDGGEYTIMAIHLLLILHGKRKLWAGLH